MDTLDKIEEIHDLIGTIEGYGRNMLTRGLGSRPEADVKVVYDVMRAYAEDLAGLSPEARIQLTNRVILGLEHIKPGKARDLGTYLEVVCFNEPLEQEHVERPGNQGNPHLVHRDQYDGDLIAGKS